MRSVTEPTVAEMARLRKPSIPDRWTSGRTSGQATLTRMGGCISGSATACREPECQGFKGRLSDADRWHVINFIKNEFTPVER